MSFDLTNKNISDTFQNLLQKTGSEGHLYDLEGNQVDNLTIGGTLTAHSYITSESIVNTSSGSTAFGNSSDDSHTFIGDITASGNISSSGDVIATAGHFYDDVTIHGSNELIVTNDGAAIMRFTNDAGRIFGPAAYGSPYLQLWGDTKLYNDNDSAGSGNVILESKYGNIILESTDDNIISSASNHIFTGSMEVVDGNISGSATSTGSFGNIIGQSSADTSVLQSPITAVLNSSVGTVDDGETFAAGISIESLLRSMLTDFIPPTFTAFVVTGLASYLEVGDTDSVSAGTFTTASSTSDSSGFENNGGSFELSMSSNATNNGGISATYSGNGAISSWSPTPITVKRTTMGTTTFTLTGTDSAGTETLRYDYTYSFLPIFYGGSSTDAGAGLSDGVLATVLSDISSSITSLGSGTSGIRAVTGGYYGTQVYPTSTSTSNLASNMIIKLPSSVANSSNYTYLVYQEDYGDLTSIKHNDATPVLGSFNKVGTADNTRFGIETTYIVYQSAGLNAFGENDTLELND